MSQVKLTADSGGGTTSLKAPSATTSNADVVLKLPVADGSANQVLKTDGSGQLSFTSNAGTTINNNADNRIITGSGTANTLEGEANCTFNGDSLGLNSSSTTEINLQYSNNTRLKIHVGSNFTQFLTQNDVPLLFKTDTGTGSGTEHLRITSAGNVGIGTSTPGGLVDIVGSANDTRALLIRNTNNSGGSAHAKIEISGGDNATAILKLECNGQNHEILEDGNGNLRIEDNDSERMRIDSSGQVHIGNTGAPSTNGFSVLETYQSTTYLQIAHNVTGAEYSYFNFNHNGSNIGSIKQNNSGNAISFNTSSDYRLKENVVSISDGITRLKTLKPSRFNFKNDTKTTVDGFLAHEVTAVPEAISGTKDEVDSDNNPVYQGIDQSKLVPLLTAALQEEVGKREALETRVAALEAA